MMYEACMLHCTFAIHRNDSVNTGYTDSHNTEHSFVTTAESIVTSITDQSVSSNASAIHSCIVYIYDCHTHAGYSVARTTVYYPTQWTGPVWTHN